MQLLLGALADAQSVLRDLQGNLSTESQEVAVLAKQQREAAERNLEAARDITQSVMTSLTTMETDANNFREHVNSSSANHDQELLDLAVVYEEHARKEHTQLVESITAMLASSLSNRTNLVQSRVKNLREIASQDALVVQQGLKKIQQEAVTANGRLNAFIATADATSVEDSALLASKVSKMEDILVSCTIHTTTSGRKWESTYKKIEQLEKAHTSVVTSILGEGMESNVKLLANLRGLEDSAQAKIETENSYTVAFVDATCTGEHEAASRMQSTMDSQKIAAAELDSSHDTCGGSSNSL